MAQLFPYIEDESFVRRLALAGCLLAILGSKAWLIGTHGSATPFWDQWDAEAALLYRPYFAGTLTLADFFAAHNEHRILLTRLTALGLLIASGRWDPILQMLFNALLHTAAIGFLLFTLGRTFDLAGRFLLGAFGLLLFSIPFGWGNTLTGFQTPFYFLILLAPLSLFVLIDSPAWTLHWWLGTLLAALSYFSVASGALTLPAFVAIAAAQFALRTRTGRREVLGMAFHALLAVLLLFDVMSLGGPLKAQSLMSWLMALIDVVSWPVAGLRWNAPLRVLAAVLLYAPVLLMAARVLKERPSIRDERWYYLALACWVGAQFAAVAYGRVTGALDTRYYDIYLVGILVSGASLFRVTFARQAPRAARAILVFAAVWLIALFWGGGQKALDHLPTELAWRRDTAVIHTENFRRYLTTGDAAALRDKPLFHIPHPSPERLIELGSDPAIRAILPPSLFGRPDRNRFNRAMLQYGRMCFPLGLALLMIASIAACRRDRPIP
jgi:hypothetical protein